MRKRLSKSKLGLSSQRLFANDLRAKALHFMLYTLAAALCLLNLGLQKLDARSDHECQGVAKEEVALKLAPAAGASDAWIVHQGEHLLVLGKSADSAWLKVSNKKGRQAWLPRPKVQINERACASLREINESPKLASPAKAPRQPSPPTTQTISAPTPLPSLTPVEGQGWRFKSIYAIGGLLILLALFGFFWPSSRRWLLGTGFSQVRKRPIPARIPHLLAAVVKPQQAVAYLEMSQQPPAYYPLNKPTITIGRDPGCEIRIAETYQTVSRRHAQIIRQGADYLVVDLNSTSGVYLDNIRVGRNKLRDGVTLNIGQVVTFTFHLNQGGVAP